MQNNDQSRRTENGSISKSKGKHVVARATWLLCVAAGMLDWLYGFVIRWLADRLIDELLRLLFSAIIGAL